MNDKAMMTMRFAGMAFCWADMLFELDREHKIVFSVGATDRLLGVGPADLMGQPFLPFIDERDRDLIAELLNVTVSSGRIDEPSARMALANETVTEVSLSGYRTPDFDDHFFLAVKVAPRRVPIQQRRAEDRDEAADVLSEGSFASVAADRIKSYQAAGGKPKVSMIKIDNMEELKGKLTSENQETMMATIGTIIKEHSLGKDTAGRIDDENFSLVHGEDVTPEMISQEIAASTADLDPDGVGLTTQSTTVDADVSALSEAEMTRALVYTMREFSKDPANVGGGNSLDGMLQRRVHETAKMVASFKRVLQHRALRSGLHAHMRPQDRRHPPLRSTDALSRRRRHGIPLRAHHHGRRGRHHPRLRLCRGQEGHPVHQGAAAQDPLHRGQRLGQLHRRSGFHRQAP
jgi:hypothetical protein